MSFQDGFFSLAWFETLLPTVEPFWEELLLNTHCFSMLPCDTVDRTSILWHQTWEYILKKMSSVLARVTQLVYGFRRFFFFLFNLILQLFLFGRGSVEAKYTRSLSSSDNICREHLLCFWCVREGAKCFIQTIKCNSLDISIITPTFQMNELTQSCSDLSGSFSDLLRKSGTEI